MTLPPPSDSLSPSSPRPPAVPTAEDAQPAKGVAGFIQRLAQRHEKRAIGGETGTASVDSAWSKSHQNSTDAPSSLDGLSSTDRLAAGESPAMVAGGHSNVHDPRGPTSEAIHGPDGQHGGASAASLSTFNDTEQSRSSPQVEGETQRPTRRRNNSANSAVSTVAPSSRHLLPAMGTVTEISNEGAVTPTSTRSDPIPSQPRDDLSPEITLPPKGDA